MNTTPPTAALVQTMRNIRSKDPFMTPAALAAHPDILSWCSRIEENMVVQLNKISVKNLRIYVILVSLYQVMLSHLLMFFVVLALLHAEEMINVLIVDIADQKEREEYYELPMHANGETMNQVRFKSASQLAAGTLSALYACAVAVGVYLLCCVLMLCGTIKYRSQLMMPWLLVHAVGGATVLSLILYYHRWAIMNLFKGNAMLFWTSLALISFVDMGFWSLCYRFCANLHIMQKMTKSATVAIPYPGKARVPYHFRRENMYIGDGGHKHRLTTTDACNPNYVV